MMKTFFVTCMALFVLFQTVIGQNSQVADSLESILALRNSIDDSERFEIYRNLAFYHPSQTKALSYSEKALEIAMAMEDDLCMAQAYEIRGVTLRLLGDRVNGLENCFQALRLYESLELPIEEAYTSLQIGEFYFEDENYSEAIQYMEGSKLLFDSLGEHRSAVLASINLGEAYRLNGAASRAIEQFQSALEDMKKLDRETDIISGYATGNLGLIFKETGKYDSAVSCLDYAINTLRSLRDNLQSPHIRLRKELFLLIKETLSLEKRNFWKHSVWQRQII